MPVVEIVSFTGSKAFPLNTASVVLEKAIEAVKKTEGCMSVYRGFQLENETRGYVITCWDSDQKPASDLRKRSCNPGSITFELNKLGSTLSTKFLIVDHDPAAVLNSTLPELFIHQLKPGHTYQDLISGIKGYYTRAQNGVYPEVTLTDIPAIALGLDSEGMNKCVVIAGWKNFKSREFVVKTRPYLELLEVIQPITDFVSECLSLDKL